MTPHIHEEAIQVLTEVWSLAPDIRLGQLLAHLGDIGEIYAGRGLGDIENDEFIAVLYHHRSELLARAQEGGLTGTCDIRRQLP